MIPARYMGDHEIILPAERGPYFDGNGQPLQPTIKSAISGQFAYGLRPGDTLMMPEEEVLGVTYLHDVHQQNPSIKVGAGKCVLKEHEGLSMDELRSLGYEFMTGRSDFQVLPAEVPATPVQQ